MSVQGTAVVTGASTGIGAAYAERLARRGYDLVLVARDVAKLETLATRLRTEFGVGAEVLPADLSDMEALARVEDRLRRDDVTLLVNNAGLAFVGPMPAMRIEDLTAMLQVNVVAAARLVHAVLPGMLERGAGTLINIASVGSLSGEGPGISVGYTASKTFMLGFSEALSGELAGTAIRVQAVLPGPTRTAIWGRSGLDVDEVIGEGVMDADVMVDASLRGLDLGESVTIPTLPDVAAWERFTEARAAMASGFKGSRPAARYT